MVEESSLRYPVADYLTGLGTPLESIELEYPHPDLFNRRIDLVTLGNGPSASEISSAMEFKIAKKETKYTGEKHRILNDLLRLQLLSKKHSATCYFLIAGRSPAFIQSFRSIPEAEPQGNRNELAEPGGFYTEWFGFSPRESKSFEVAASDNEEYMGFYSDFLASFSSSNQDEAVELPSSITTTCRSISALSKKYPTPYVGGIWQVD